MRRLRKATNRPPGLWFREIERPRDCEVHDRVISIYRSD